MTKPGDTLICAVCDKPFTYWRGKPGRIGDCYACARDIETPVAGDSDPEGEWAVISRRERRQFVSARWLMSGAA